MTPERLAAIRTADASWQPMCADKDCGERHPDDDSPEAHRRLLLADRDRLVEDLDTAVRVAARLLADRDRLDVERLARLLEPILYDEVHRLMAVIAKRIAAYAALTAPQEPTP